MKWPRMWQERCLWKEGYFLNFDVENEWECKHDLMLGLFQLHTHFILLIGAVFLGYVVGDYLGTGHS